MAYITLSLIWIYLLLPIQSFDIRTELLDVLNGDAPKPKLSVKCIMGLASLTPQEVITMVDAWPKPQPGTTQGNIYWYGDFNECVTQKKFKYCLMTSIISLTNNQGFPNITSILRLGECMPKQCTEKDVIETANFVVAGINKQLDDTGYSMRDLSNSLVSCAKTDPVWKHPVGLSITLVIIAIILILNLVGTILDSALSQQDSNAYVSLNAVELRMSNEPLPEDTGSARTSNIRKNIFIRFFLTFSISSNLSKLSAMKQSVDSIDSLNGIRVFSLIWVLFCHIFLQIVINMPISNPADIVRTSERLMDQYIVNGFYAVDSFFFLSAFLMSYHMLNTCEKRKGRLPWAMVYVHRIARLLPVYAITILLSMYVYPLLGNGPTWQSTWQPMYKACEDYWFTNMLFINNFYPNSIEGCMGWTWYLANDMQFFLISPPIIYLLYRSWKLALGLISTLYAISITVTSAILISKDISPLIGIAFIENPLEADLMNEKYMSDIYIKPYARIQPYLIGIIFGYVFHRLKRDNIQIKIPLVVNIIGWIVSVVLMVVCVCFQYFDYHNHTEMSMVSRVIYVALLRGVWAIALCWVVFACHYKHGGFVSEILSFKIWMPIGRLTYLAYLNHFLVMLIVMCAFTEPLMYNSALVICVFVGIISVTFLISFIVSLLVEFPVGALFKLLEGKLK